ncbi:hypothetical protein ScPMuIL_010276 [Solemya velum]
MDDIETKQHCGQTVDLSIRILHVECWNVNHFESQSSKLLVAAIDFGTTFSGYAFSFRHEYETDPTKVTGKVWYSSTGLLAPMKAPTCLLLRPDKTFSAFGYEAENNYSELVVQKEHRRWYYFRRFKMMLHDGMGMKRDIELEDETGKKVSAITVFSLAIEFLKRDLLENCRNKLTDIYERDIQWVLTTPAIWSDGAKQFMREAAVKAGISGDSLTIALEPEAASIYCRHIPLQRGERNKKSHLETFNPGSKYLVLDAGGGTVDITVHEVTHNLSIKELHQASGGPWGGTKVDEEFQKLLISIIGSFVFEEFKRNDMCSYLELLSEFELKKRSVAPDSNHRSMFVVSASLLHLFEARTGKTIQDVISKMDIGDQVKWDRGKIRIESTLMQEFFVGPIREIIAHIRKLFQQGHLYDVSTI